MGMRIGGRGKKERNEGGKEGLIKGVAGGYGCTIRNGRDFRGERFRGVTV